MTPTCPRHPNTSWGLVFIGKHHKTNPKHRSHQYGWMSFLGWVQSLHQKLRHWMPCENNRLLGSFWRWHQPGVRMKPSWLWGILCCQPGWYGCWTKNRGFLPPQIIHLFRGFSIIFTIHFGVPLVLETSICCQPFFGISETNSWKLLQREKEANNKQSPDNSLWPFWDGYVPPLNG